ncbi:soluble lytic murein transglycosylase [Palleronia aestuarii]|uniref:Soluble lytic murein transglycosylase n=1 Tax=Palleronia aestuarii TaxID=568105 RepID=A0A2W7NL91_9RHOB|nr:lytic transglycosylase domain-containing protein [Palleronia aestuarii]PZX18877.1 soluble lytic murein transglycosylase [Palleronia aestuarii]
MILRRLLPLLLAGVLILPAAARAVETPPPDGNDMSLGLADALDEVRAGRWISALEAGARAGPIGRDVVEWLRLRDGLGDWPTVRDFLARNGDWPDVPLLRRRTEKFLPLGFRDAEAAKAVLDFFSGSEPATGHGVASLVEAYRFLGRDGDAEAQAAEAWITLSMTEGAEAFLLHDYADLLAPLESMRMDRMFWSGAEAALRRSVARSEGDLAARGRARLAARVRGVTDVLLEDLPAPLRQDAGLAHIRFGQHLRDQRLDDAVALMRARSASAEMLGDPDAWADERIALARRLMRGEERENAYAVAASHWLVEGSDYAELEWLSGYLALRFLDRPEAAVTHFQRFRDAVATPISLGRAGYWLGRAYEAAGDDDAARDAFAMGAAYQTSFYGLLAAERIGVPLDPGLTGQQVYPPLDESGFAGSSVFEAALLLQAAGERDLAETFFRALADRLDEADLGTLGDVALALGEPHLALLIAKQAAQRGITLPRAYYPVVSMGVVNMPVDPALALTIARRESEFDPGVASGVGARGLMQLMPATARDVARTLDLPFSAARLFSDPSYNATLGSAYLAGLIARFGDNPILVSAGYNAGPGRPIAWIEENGDPRSAEVDVIDWIEHIPFDETRNYVMRVAESLPVYRARLEGRVAPVEFTALLKGR